MTTFLAVLAIVVPVVMFVLGWALGVLSARVDNLRQENAALRADRAAFDDEVREPWSSWGGTKASTWTFQLPDDE